MRRVGGPPSLRRIVLCAAAALCVGLAIVSVLSGFSADPPLRLLEAVAVFGAGAAVLGGAALVCMLTLAGWEEPASEAEFEALVRRSEALAAAGMPKRRDLDAPDGLDAPGGLDTPNGRGGLPGLGEESIPTVDVDALIRRAIDELPLEFHRVLEHVAVVVGDDGWRYRAYGLYQGDTVAHDHFHDRIVIFRDTLLRDFGHDPALLGAQVRRTVRHELAHHLGYSERGVQGLGL